MKERKQTDHSCELVELWLEVWSPEVDVCSFISHLVTGRRTNPNVLKCQTSLGPLSGDVPVVGRWEDGDALPWVGDLVTLSFDLVAADDVVQLVLLQEALRHVGAELAAHAPLADRPSVLQETRRGRETSTLQVNGCWREDWPEAAGLTREGHTWGLWRERPRRSVKRPSGLSRSAWIWSLTWVWRLSISVDLPDVIQRDAVFAEQPAVHHLKPRAWDHQDADWEVKTSHVGLVSHCTVQTGLIHQDEISVGSLKKVPSFRRDGREVPDDQDDPEIFNLMNVFGSNVGL